jgi:hypothetical protein
MADKMPSVSLLFLRVPPLTCAERSRSQEGMLANSSMQSLLKRDPPQFLFAYSVLGFALQRLIGRFNHGILYLYAQQMRGETRRMGVRVEPRPEARRRPRSAAHNATAADLADPTTRRDRPNGGNSASDQIKAAASAQVAGKLLTI